MKWYLKVLRQFADFSGRARRKEYWYFAFVNVFFTCVAITADIILGVASDNFGVGPIYILYSILVFIPSIAVSVRRLHDIGKSGWMLLVVLIPVIGAIWLLVLLFTDSNAGDNNYGSNPKNEATT